MDSLKNYRTYKSMVNLKNLDQVSLSTVEENKTVYINYQIKEIKNKNILNHHVYSTYISPH
jgi:hypothetical protein